MELKEELWREAWKTKCKVLNPYNGIERGVLSHILLSSLRYKNPYNGIERRLTTTTFY
jgi:hypothetical protein